MESTYPPLAVLTVVHELYFKQFSKHRKNKVVLIEWITTLLSTIGNCLAKIHQARKFFTILTFVGGFPQSDTVIVL